MMGTNEEEGAIKRKSTKKKRQRMKIPQPLASAFE